MAFPDFRTVEEELRTPSRHLLPSLPISTAAATRGHREQPCTGLCPAAPFFSMPGFLLPGSEEGQNASLGSFLYAPHVHTGCFGEGTSSFMRFRPHLARFSCPLLLKRSGRW